MKTSKKISISISFWNLFLMLLPILFNSCQFSGKSGNLKSDYDPVTQDIIIKDSIYPGISTGMFESEGSLLKFAQFNPTGKGPHPTLILLHGYTGITGNADIAYALSRAGWNVIFFRYRGSWGMPGEFSFQHCVEDAINIANYCKNKSDLMHVDTARIALFGHSMGGWVALKSAVHLKFVKKIFVLSTWNLYNDVLWGTKKNILDSALIKPAESLSEIKISSGKALFEPVLKDTAAFMLTTDLQKMKGKYVFMLDEHKENKFIADSLRKYTQGLGYEVWDKTDHSFTNKRIAMLRKLISFLND
jgi:pimeloyl-ACP methyl ester carboxylesterase